MVKSIDEANGSTGAEILENSHMDETDLPDVLNGLINSGYLEAYAPGETLPLVQEIHPENFRTVRFDFNPAYIAEIRKAARRG